MNEAERLGEKIGKAITSEKHFDISDVTQTTLGSVISNDGNHFICLMCDGSVFVADQSNAAHALPIESVLKLLVRNIESVLSKNKHT